MSRPFTRVDVALIAAAAATGVSNAVAAAVRQRGEVGAPSDAALRFLEMPVLHLAWDGSRST